MSVKKIEILKNTLHFNILSYYMCVIDHSRCTEAQHHYVRVSGAKKNQEIFLVLHTFSCLRLFFYLLSSVFFIKFVFVVDKNMFDTCCLWLHEHQLNVRHRSNQHVLKHLDQKCTLAPFTLAHMLKSCQQL